MSLVNDRVEEYVHRDDSDSANLFIRYEKGFFMKKPKVEISKPDFKLWCESCCLRIAPLEERTVVLDKAYHPRCYSKLSPKA